MKQTAYELNKEKIRDSFNSAARLYDDVAILQKEIGIRLIERLELIKLHPQHILDIGSGTGSLTPLLSKRYKKSEIISLDLSTEMLKLARAKQPAFKRIFSKNRYLCGDADYLPLRDNSVDMIFSNLAIQWCSNLDTTFNEFSRVLKPNGLLMFTTFGPDTLKELRNAWQSVDNNVHVNAFIDMHDIGDALLRSGLSDPVMDTETLTLTYSDSIDILRDLKAMGAHNVMNGRSRSLTGKNKLKQMLLAYEGYRMTDNTLPATYEAIYGHAWGAEIKRQNSSKDGTVSIPLDHLKRHPQ